jgi:anaerobic glycerol-3-phosphate dehydrogenase
VNPIEADVLVIGAGAAGIAAARSAHEAGAKVSLVSLAGGATALSSGVAWGHARDPFAQWAAGDVFRLGGRYVTVAGWVIANAQGALASLLDLGAVTGMVGVVDLATHPSWSARLIAETLGARIVSAPFAPEGETFRETASRFDTDGIAEGVAARLRASCEGLGAVLFPPVLGLRRDDVSARMTAVLGVPVGEAAGGAGDPTGVRFERAMRRWVPDAVRVIRGRATVLAGSRAAARLDDGNTVRARAIVLATGGLTGGGVVFDGALREATAGAPMWTRTRERIAARSGAERGADPSAWFADGQPRGVGVRVDARRRVLDVDGEAAVAPWLFAAGEVATALDGEGLVDALASGARAGAEAARHARGG